MADKTHALNVAAMALQPAFPDLTGAELGLALSEHRSDKQRAADVAPGTALTVEETARRLSCSRKTVFELLRTGRLPRVKLGPRATRIPAAAVVELLEGRR